MDLAIRFTQDEDLAALFALDHLAQEENAERREYIHQAMQTKTCLTAFWKGLAAGYGVLEYSFFGCGFISMVYIGAAYRRFKIGQSLVAEMEQLCRTDKLFTSTNHSNLPMMALLSKMGYSLSGVVYNLDEGDPEMIYFKKLR
jgi:GNAT superfamily N-acetyltransferase